MYITYVNTNPKESIDILKRELTLKQKAHTISCKL